MLPNSTQLSDYSVMAGDPPAPDCYDCDVKLCEEGSLPNPFERLDTALSKLRHKWRSTHRSENESDPHHDPPFIPSNKSFSISV